MRDWLYGLVRRFTWKMNKHYWMEVRADAYMACNGLCWFCGYPVDIVDFTVDHIISMSRGGTDELYNLRIGHEMCHLKHHRNRGD